MNKLWSLYPKKQIIGGYLLMFCNQPEMVGTPWSKMGEGAGHMECRYDNNNGETINQYIVDRKKTREKSYQNMNIGGSFFPHAINSLHFFI